MYYRKLSTKIGLAGSKAIGHPERTSKCPNVKCVVNLKDHIMFSKQKKVLSAFLLVAFVTASAFALRPEPIEYNPQNTVMWTRTHLTDDDWIQGNGGPGPCESADFLCQILLPEDFDPNDHDYEDVVEIGSPVGTGQNGYKPQ